MKIFGITGGIGSGKSEIINYIASHYDATVVQADTVGHVLMKPEETCYQPIIDLLGRDIVMVNKELDRGKIASIVYADTVLLTKLNGIIHPAVKNYIQKTIEREKAKGKAYFFVEAALLLEDHYDQICDEIWYVYADEEVRRERLRCSRGYSDEKIQKIFDNQLSEEAFSKCCDYKISNSNSIEETIRQIDMRMQRYENV